jgi:nucleotide-binding universal stress UspA family protein
MTCAYGACEDLIGRSRMSIRLLVVLDESTASRRAVDYVAKLVGHQHGLQLCLAHLLPPLQPGLPGSSSDEDAQQGQRQHARFKARQQRWRSAAKRSAQRAFARAKAALRKAGVPAKALDVQFFGAVDGDHAADRILDVARASRCHTVVVGRGSLSWFREFLRRDLPAELVRRGEGFTIWVVE